MQENKNYFPKLEEYANTIFDKIQVNNRTTYLALNEYLKKEYNIIVKDVIPEERKPFSKFTTKEKRIIAKDYVALETKKLFVADRYHEGAIKIINNYLAKFSFPSDES